MTTPTHTTDNTVPPSHIQTFTGRHINPFDPDPAAIDIEDIAHALSNICRFTGHTRHFYSVAEHSVRVSDLVWRNTQGMPEPARSRAALMALLHDACEAYMTDIPRPLKRYVYIRPSITALPLAHASQTAYFVMETNLLLTIYQRFGLAGNDISQHAPAIQEADLILLATERRDLLTPTSYIWPEIEHLTPLADQLYPQVPSIARENFMDAFARLTQDPRP